MDEVYYWKNEQNSCPTFIKEKSVENIKSTTRKASSQVCFPGFRHITAPLWKLPYKPLLTEVILNSYKVTISFRTNKTISNMSRSSPEFEAVHKILLTCMQVKMLLNSSPRLWGSVVLSAPFRDPCRPPFGIESGTQSRSTYDWGAAEAEAGSDGFVSAVGSAWLLVSGTDNRRKCCTARATLSGQML